MLPIRNLLCFCFFFNVYLFWKRESVSRRGREKRMNPKQAPRCHVSTERDAGVTTWAKIESQTLNQLSHPSTPSTSLYLFKKKIFTFIYFWEKEHKWGRGRERRRHRIRSRLQTPSCQHRAQQGAQTHKSLDHDLSRSQTLNWLSHTGAPRTSL